MRRATILAALLAALTTLGCGAGTALAAKNMDVTIQDDGVFLNHGYYSQALGLDQAAGLGATRIRVNLYWAQSLTGNLASRKKAPKKLTYNFAPFDQLIQAAAQRGMRVDLTLVGPAPAFATSNHRIGERAPGAKSFGTFARAVAKHFKGKVNRYSIWNEPNLYLWLAPAKKSASIYRNLYSAAYKSIKKADRKAQVLIGETAPYSIPKRTIAPLKWLRDMTCVNGRYQKRKRCKTLFADGYAHHPYDFTHKPSFKGKAKDNATLGSLGNLTRALAKLAKAKALSTPRHKTLGVYLTEYGYYHNVPKTCTKTERKRSISQSKQASYTTQAFGMAQRNKSVHEMLQYLLVNPPAWTSSPCFATGLLLADGKATKAYTQLRSWVTKAARKHQVARKPKTIKLR